MDFTLIIKGDLVAADHATMGRGIRVLSMEQHPKFNEVTAIVQELPMLDLAQWFTGPEKVDPATGARADGALLWYGPRIGEKI